MLVPGVAVVAAHPAPFDLVAGGVHQHIEALPQVYVFDRLLGGGFPAPGFPASNPFSHAFEHVLAVHVQRDMAGPFQGGQGFNHGQQLHAVVGGVKFTAKQLLVGVAGLEPHAPATGAWVALAGTIGVNIYCVQSVLLVF